MKFSTSTIKRLGLSLILATPLALGILSNPPAAAASCTPSVSATSSTGGTVGYVIVKGECFTSGGSVYVYVRDRETGAVRVNHWITASSWTSVVCSRYS